MGSGWDSTACLATRHVRPKPHGEVAWRAEGPCTSVLGGCIPGTVSRVLAVFVDPSIPRSSEDQAGACAHYGSLAGAGAPGYNALLSAGAIMSVGLMEQISPEQMQACLQSEEGAPGKACVHA